MKVGIFAPYLRVGGGEKYIGKIAEVLSEKNNVEILSFQEIDLSELESKLDLDLSKVKIKHFQRNHIPIRSLSSIFSSLAIEKASMEYDLFINQEQMTFIPSHSKRSILIQEVPPSFSKNIFEQSVRALMFFLGDPKCESYDKIITNSNYTKRHIEGYYRKDTVVLYPPVDTDQFKPLYPKERIVLSVGRFFKSFHCKKQVLMIRVFKELCDRGLVNWEYHLVGAITSNSHDQEYLKECAIEAKGYPIYIHTNAPFEFLKQMYGKAMIFWHATGLGENEKYHPERFEHFGISTVESMSAGCVPVVINKGGPREVVRHKTDGFLWDTVEELKEYSMRLVNNPNLWLELSEASVKRSREFGIGFFEKKVKDLFC